MTVKALLTFIGKVEGRNDYNVVWGRINKLDHPPKPLTTMTIREVLAWQDKIDARYQSEAAGTYQILEDTLRGLYAEAGLTLDDKFDINGQDALAVQLLKRRGLKQFLAGATTVEQFCNEIAKEWASMPVVSGPKAGKSYYGGDGLNKSLVPVDVFKGVVASVRDNQPLPPIGVDTTPVTPSFWVWLFRLLTGSK